MTRQADLSRLPPPGTKRVAVRLTKSALRQVRRGHPWIYQNAIVSTSFEGAPGDLAVVFDDDRRFAAIGLYDPASPIRIRVLHAGDPLPIDAGFFANRLQAAAALRARLAERADTTAYRLVNGENDGFGGLVVDRYDDALVVKLYSAAWLPHLGMLVSQLSEHADANHIVLRLARHLSRGETHGLADGDDLLGAAPDRQPFLENGLAFTADLRRGQKTGHFLDQRDNRALVAERCDGARVIDVFSSTGGFTVHAAAGGARSVTSVDRDRHAMDACISHLGLNRDRVGATSHVPLVGDGFESLADLARSGRRFDVAIVDPPSFAQKQTDVDGAIRAYRRLTERAVAVIEPGGTLVQASCSSRVTAEVFFDTVTAAAAKVGVSLTDVTTTGHALDHPVAFDEGAYLNALFATVS